MGCFDHQSYEKSGRVGESPCWLWGHAPPLFANRGKLFFCMFVGWGEFRALADIVVGTRKHQKSLLVFVVLLALINHPKQINDMLLSNT